MKRRLRLQQSVWRLLDMTNNSHCRQKEDGGSEYSRGGGEEEGKEEEEEEVEH